MSIYIIDNGCHYSNHEIWFVDVGKYSYLADKWLKYLSNNGFRNESYSNDYGNDYGNPYLIGISDKIEWRNPESYILIKDWISPQSFIKWNYLSDEEGYSKDKFLYKHYKQDYSGNWVSEDQIYCLDLNASNYLTKEDWNILYTLWGEFDEDDTNSLYLLFLRNKYKEKVVCISKDKCVDDRLKIGPFILVEE